MTTDIDEALRLARELIAANEQAYVMPGSLLLARALITAAAENERLRDLLPRCDGPMCKPSNAAEPLHPCPYKEDVDGNSTDLCNCCETCRLECERNI